MLQDKCFELLKIFKHHYGKGKMNLSLKFHSVLTIFEKNLELWVWKFWCMWIFVVLFHKTFLCSVLYHIFLYTGLKISKIGSHKFCLYHRYFDFFFFSCQLLHQKLFKLIKIFTSFQKIDKVQTWWKFQTILKTFEPNIDHWNF